MVKNRIPIICKYNPPWLTVVYPLVNQHEHGTPDHLKMYLLLKNETPWKMTLRKTNIAMDNPPFWWYFPGKTGTFYGYVSLPDGKILNPKWWRFGSNDFPFQFSMISRFQPFNLKTLNRTLRQTWLYSGMTSEWSSSIHQGVSGNQWWNTHLRSYFWSFRVSTSTTSKITSEYLKICDAYRW